MVLNRLSIATCNLYNLNEPGLPMYTNQTGWAQEEYAKKINFFARQLRETAADIWGFQELWHADSLTQCFDAAGLSNDYTLLTPNGQSGQRIVCAGAVKNGLLEDTPEWIENFPPEMILRSRGDDPQTSQISVNIDRFSRPILHFKVRPRPNDEAIHVYVCHFKSKAPTAVFRESWYERDTHSKHSAAIGSALSTIRRTAEAAALRMLLTNVLRDTDTPVIVMGDINDGEHSNTLNVLTSQPRYLMGDSRGGTDAGLYAVGALQAYRSLRDVYYTHIYQDVMESLDHILVSQEFYDNSRKRVWAFDGMDIRNDHLNDEDHKQTGSTDHGIVCARFKFSPAK
jgi:hypothetical protein